MNKKTILIGILVIIIGIVIYVVARATATLPFTLMNTTLASGRFNNLTLNTSSSKLFLYSVEASSPINVYVFNSSAYRTWSGSVTNSGFASGLNEAKALEGQGTLYTYINTTTLLFASGEGTSTDGNLIYKASNHTLNASSFYVFVLQDANGNATNPGAVETNASYLPPVTQSELSNNKALGNYILTGVLFLISIVVIVAGLIVAIYGLFRKPKTTPATTEQGIKERDELYKNIDKNSRKSAKKYKKDTKDASE